MMRTMTVAFARQKRRAEISRTIADGKTVPDGSRRGVAPPLLSKIDLFQVETVLGLSCVRRSQWAAAVRRRRARKL